MILKALLIDLSCSDPSLIARSRPNFVTILIAVGVRPPRLSIENGRNSMLSLDTAPPICTFVFVMLMEGCTFVFVMLMEGSAGGESEYDIRDGHTG